ncbi:hypothetical protein E2C01_064274 [Portunus trituberculatus]|uniref:Uncharacterized protein n=1 Tax=Portunus trituberculatus TaxID=210409 RepID=A0A5B7HJY5_PORTR|nr:hypothetical protein [Portunus trituberculatus]
MRFSSEGVKTVGVYRISALEYDRQYRSLPRLSERKRDRLLRVGAQLGGLLLLERHGAELPACQR